MLPISMSPRSGEPRRAAAASGSPYWSRTLLCTKLNTAASRTEPRSGSTRGRLGTPPLSELGQRADHGRARLGLAPAVADLLEPLHGGAAFAYRILAPAAPQRDVGEQHVHHADGPRVARREAFDRDLLRELGRFVEPPLHVAHEREQAERPPEPTPVTEFAEQLGALLQAVLGGARVTA